MQSEEYAVSIDLVNEVVKAPPIAPIPQTPEFVLGVANIRGNVIAILDLGAKMGFSHDRNKADGYVMVIRNDDFEIGLMVDQVPDSIPVKASQVDQSSSVMVTPAQEHGYIKGIIKTGDRMIISVDLEDMMAGLEI